MTKIDKIIKIDNSANDESISFVPRGQNLTYTVGAGDTLEFKVRTSSDALYYVKSIGEEHCTTQDHFDDGPTPGDLPLFNVGDNLTSTSMIANINMSNDEINTWLTNNIDGEIALVSILHDGQSYPVLVADTDTSYGHIIGYTDILLYCENEYTYIDKDTGKEVTIPAGWQYEINIEGDSYTIIDRQTGAIDLSAIVGDGFEISEVNNALSGWNGVIIGNQQKGTNLTPFTENQQVVGIDFGDVSNGDTSDAMDSFLSGLTYDDWQVTLIMAADPQALDKPNQLISAVDLGVMTSGQVTGYCIQSGSASITYSTVEFNMGMVVPRGYNNLTNGKQDLSPMQVVTSVSNVQGWNGTLIGAIESE